MSASNIVKIKIKTCNKKGTEHIMGEDAIVVCKYNKKK